MGSSDSMRQSHMKEGGGNNYTDSCFLTWLFHEQLPYPMDLVSPFKILHCELKSTIGTHHPAIMKTCVSLIVADWATWRIIQTNAPQNAQFGKLTTAKLGHLYPFNNLSCYRYRTYLHYLIPRYLPTYYISKFY